MMFVANHLRINILRKIPFFDLPVSSNRPLACKSDEGDGTMGGEVVCSLFAGMESEDTGLGCVRDSRLRVGQLPLIGSYEGSVRDSDCPVNTSN